MTGSIPLFTSLFGFAEKAARWAVLASGALTIARVLLITFDVLARKFFG